MAPVPDWDVLVFDLFFSKYKLRLAYCVQLRVTGSTSISVYVERALLVALYTFILPILFDMDIPVVASS